MNETARATKHRYMDYILYELTPPYEDNYRSDPDKTVTYTHCLVSHSNIGSPETLIFGENLPDDHGSAIGFAQRGNVSDHEMLDRIGYTLIRAKESK